MGEVNTVKPLYCLVCDTVIQIDESFSIFCTVISTSGSLLANSVEKNLFLKDIGKINVL